MEGAFKGQNYCICNDISFSLLKYSQIQMRLNSSVRLYSKAQEWKGGRQYIEYVYNL